MDTTVLIILNPLLFARVEHTSLNKVKQLALIVLWAPILSLLKPNVILALLVTTALLIIDLLSNAQLEHTHWED